MGIMATEKTKRRVSRLLREEKRLTHTFCALSLLHPTSATSTRSATTAAKSAPLAAEAAVLGMAREAAARPAQAPDV
jgi:hypothetical protein